MTNIKQIKELRRISCVSIKYCKEALQNSKGDIDLALQWMKKHNLGVSKIQKSQGLSSGVVSILINESSGVIIKLLCQTDFVAKSKKFIDLAEKIASIAIKSNNITENNTINDLITEKTNIFGESIILNKIEKLSVNQGVIIPYIHNKYTANSGKIAVLVVLEGDICTQVQDFGKTIAMHIAVYSPLAISKDTIDPTLLKQENNLYRYQANLLGKSDIVTQKIVEKKMQRYYSENTLLQQKFIMDEQQTVEQTIKNLGLSAKFKIKDFKRSEIANK